MKLFVNARFLTQPITGVQRYGIECSRQIKKLYPETVWICPKGVLDEALKNELGAIEIGRNTGHIWEQADLPLFLRSQGNPPLLNFANTAPLFYANNYLVLHDLAFYHHPEWNSKLFAAWYNFLIPRIAKRAWHIFTVSETVKVDIEAAYNVPGDKITVAYNGISQILRNTLQASTITDTKEKIILSVGTFNARKNQGNLVKAFLRSAVKDQYELILVGNKNKVFKNSGLPQDEKSLAHQHVRILEDISETELVQLYRRAEIVASVSRYEGFGIPLLEGIYCGCKILCSDIPVYRELYSDVSVFCDPEDTDSIATALSDVVTSDETRKASFMEHLLSQYSYEQSAEKIMAVIKGQLSTPVN